MRLDSNSQPVSAVFNGRFERTKKVGETSGQDFGTWQPCTRGHLSREPSTYLLLRERSRRSPLGLRGPARSRLPLPQARRGTVPLTQAAETEIWMSTRPQTLTSSTSDDLGKRYVELQRLRDLVEQAEKRRAIHLCGRRIESGTTYQSWQWSLLIHHT